MSPEREDRNSADVSLVEACRIVIEINKAFEISRDEEMDNQRFGELEAACDVIANTPAVTAEGRLLKAVALLTELPKNYECNDLCELAMRSEQLAWSLARDIVDLAAVPAKASGVA